MNAADVIGWIWNDDYYCPACAPSNEEDEKAQAIFADSETDAFNHCCTCEELIPEQLTGDGQELVTDHFKEYLVRRSGRVSVLRQWHEATKNYDWEEREQRVICDLVGEALSETSLALTRANMKRKEDK
jgi:hypothetical protein